MSKSTVEQIRERFDKDVERFSKLEVGNTSQIDSVLSLELIAEAAVATTPAAQTVLDVGCGAGNYVVKLLEYLPSLDVTLLDLSAPMLKRAQERVAEMTKGTISLIQGDVREAAIGEDAYDVILASAVLHHLREEDEWRAVFAKLYAALRSGGSLWIYDLVQHAAPEVHALFRRRHADYLTEIGGEAYRDKVFGWIEQEDTPRPLMFQIDLLRSVGFRDVEILHKKGNFAAFGGRK